MKKSNLVEGGGNNSRGLLELLGAEGERARGQRPVSASVFDRALVGTGVAA